jgi:hypothetical protein
LLGFALILTLLVDDVVFPDVPTTFGVDVGIRSTTTSPSLPVLDVDRGFLLTARSTGG